MDEKYIITRTTNGWILEIPTEDPAGNEYNRTAVFQDNEEIVAYVATADSLSGLLWEAFGCYYQQKNVGGLVVEIRKNGREHE
jgi:hypothetical protein